MTNEIVILGAGGHGQVCADVAIDAGFKVEAFVDPADNLGKSINGIDVVTAQNASEISDRFEPFRYNLFVAIGANQARMRLIEGAEREGFSLPALVHSSAVISPSAQIEAGTVVVANSVVNANAQIGKGCILNTTCSIDHNCVLEDGVQICPGVRAAGNVFFGKEAFVGTGAVIVSGVRVGSHAEIAAGALVIKDVAEGERIGRFPSRPERT